ncbi:MAG: hypothetical protein D6816_07125 [Bacteroidetes bacterium]|nr:MAG: hypothetical protein D6816_07125 [Bacteroidota bacterium]
MIFYGNLIATGKNIWFNRIGEMSKTNFIYSGGRIAMSNCIGISFHRQATIPKGDDIGCPKKAGINFNQC